MELDKLKSYLVKEEFTQTVDFVTSISYIGSEKFFAMLSVDTEELGEVLSNLIAKRSRINLDVYDVENENDVQTAFLKPKKNNRLRLLSTINVDKENRKKVFDSLLANNDLIEQHQLKVIVIPNHEQYSDIKNNYQNIFSGLGFSTVLFDQQTAIEQDMLIEFENEQAKKDSVEKLKTEINDLESADDKDALIEKSLELARLLQRINDHENAVIYYEKALSASKSTDNSIRTAHIHRQTGSCYNAIENRQKAEENYTEALKICENENDTKGEAEALNDLARHNLILENFDKSIELAQKIIDTADLSQHKEALCESYINLTRDYTAKEQFDTATNYADKAKELFLTIEQANIILKRRFSSALATLHSAQNNFTETLKYFREILTLDIEADNFYDSATSLVRIGYLFRSISENSFALKYFEKAEELFTTIDDNEQLVGILQELGKIHISQATSLSLKYFVNAKKIAEKTNDIPQTIETLNLIAIALGFLEQHKKSLTAHNEALELSKSINDKNKEAQQLESIGQIWDAGLEDKPKALDYYQNALVVVQEIGDREWEANLLSAIGNIHLMEEDEENDPLEFFTKSLEIFKENENKTGIISQLCNIANVYSWENPKLAVSNYQEALALSKEMNDLELQAEILNNLYGIFEAEGNDAEAKKLSDELLVISDELSV